MSLYLYSEGGRDLGDEEAFMPDAIGGPLRALTERILGKDGLHIVARPLSRVHGRADQEEPTRGYDKKVARALRDAQREEAEAVVVVVDRDGPGGAKRLQQLKAGREHAAVPTPSALGVAQEMVESWLFGDRAAFERTFGAVPTGLPSHPESETGGRGSPRYAKTWLEHALAPFRARDERFVALYTRLAACIDTAELEATCPQSFAPFAEEVRTNLAPAFQAYPPLSRPLIRAQAPPPRPHPLPLPPPHPHPLPHRHSRPLPHPGAVRAPGGSRASSRSSCRTSGRAPTPAPCCASSGLDGSTGSPYDPVSRGGLLGARRGRHAARPRQ